MNRRTNKRFGRIGVCLALVGQWFIALPPAHAGLAALDAFHVGRYHLANGEREKALESFNDAVRMNPQFVQAYIARGKLLAEMGNFESALADLSYALRLQPTHAEGFAYRGYALLSLGKPQEAVPEFEMALRLDPSYARVYFLRGQALAVLGDAAGAEANIAAARRIDPTMETTQVVTAGADGSLAENIALAGGSNSPVRNVTSVFSVAPVAPPKQGWGDRTVRFEDHPLLGQISVPHNARPRQDSESAQRSPSQALASTHQPPRRRPAPVRHLPDLTSDPEPTAAAISAPQGPTPGANSSSDNVPPTSNSVADTQAAAPKSVTLSPATKIDVTTGGEVSPTGVMPSATPQSPSTAGASTVTNPADPFVPVLPPLFVGPKGAAERVVAKPPAPAQSAPGVKTIVVAPPVVVEDDMPKMPVAGEILDGRIGDLVGAPPKPHPQQSLDRVQAAIEQARENLGSSTPSAAHVSDDGSTSPTQPPPAAKVVVADDVAEQAEAAYRRGLACEEQQDVDGALVAYSNAVRLNPNHPLSLCRRGHLLSETYRTAEALADFEAAIRLAPGLSNGYFGRAHVMYVTHRFEEALDDYTIAVRLDDQHAQALIERGHCYAQLGQMERAAADRRAALDLDPSLAKTGPKYALETNGTNAKARPSATAIITDAVVSAVERKSEPNAVVPVSKPVAIVRENLASASANTQAVSGSAFGNLFAPSTSASSNTPGAAPASIAATDHGVARLAIPQTTSALHVASADASATLPVATDAASDSAGNQPKRLDVDDRGAEIASLGEGLLQSPGDARLYFRRASLLVERHDFENALDDLNAAVRLNPDFVEALALRGLAHVQVERYPAAQADFTELSRLNPRDPSVYSERGYVRLCLGLKDEAIADFSKALELDGSRADVYCQRALAFALSGDEAHAMRDFDEALRRGPNEAETYLCRGKAYAEFGHAREALADFDRALELDPNKAEAYFERSRLFAERGAHERATADRRRALQLDPTLR